MKHTSVRTFIAGLGFTFFAASALAQADAVQPAPASATPPPTAQAVPAAPMPQGAGPHGSMHRQHQAAAQGGGEGPMGQIPQAVLDQLALAPAQKAQFDSAQAARKELQASKQSLRAEQRKAMTEQFAKEVIDPRAILAQHKQMRSAIETKMEAVQQKWLAFWDGLSAPQKMTLSNYMKSKHAEHTQKKPAAAKG
jgi:Spy/CpxP family protein refolding chaperone